MTYNTILFDIDGTLCDPGNSIVESAKYALSEMGIQETNQASLRRFVGPPLEHSFMENYGFNASQTDQAVTLFRHRIQKYGLKLYKNYDGIPELLEQLRLDNKNLAIVTSKVEHIAKNVLENAGLIEYFTVIGAQQPNEVVHKENVLARVLQELDIQDASSVLMVGDRMHDIEAANKHGVDSVGVLWGYGSTDEFEKAGATYIVATIEELLDVITGGTNTVA